MNQTLHPSSPSRSQSSLWRVFCAVELPFELRRLVGNHIEALRKAFPETRASWERIEKIHITLKFLGEIEEARVEALSAACERAAQSVSPFELQIEGAGAFPARGVPHVLWLGVKDSGGSLARLQKLLEDECFGAGFKRDERSFHPHLTIARIRSSKDARHLAGKHRETGFEPREFEVKELLVIRSELGPGGSRYTAISRHTLKAAENRERSR